MTVLRNELNQGYGGNQKIGYTFAIERGFDVVVLLHGDGQYAPEEMPRLLEPLQEGRADAVFGSRMMTTFGALRGGMPLYKYVGNRLLTTVQNALLRTRLSEFHSGYRAYAVPALRRIRFPLNSNDFHFDTEIIIQLLNVGQRIVEVPIPTLLRRRDLLRRRRPVRQGRPADDVPAGRPRPGGVQPAPVRAAGRRSRQQPLRRQARLPEQPPVRPRRRARRAAGCSTSARGPAAWPRSSSRRAARSPSSTSSRPRTRPATSRSSSRTSTTPRSSTPASTTTC